MIVSFLRSLGGRDCGRLRRFGDYDPGIRFGYGFVWSKLKAPRMDPLGSGSRFKPHLLSKDTPSDAIKLLVKPVTPFK